MLNMMFAVTIIAIFISALLALLFGITLPSIFDFVAVYLPESKRKKREDQASLQIAQEALRQAYCEKNSDDSSET